MPDINATIADKLITHAHNVAFFERTALEQFTDVLVGEFSDAVEGSRLPTRKRLQAAVSAAVSAGRTALEPLMVELVLAARRNAGRALRELSGGILTEDRSNVSPAIRSSVGVFRPMTRKRAQALVSQMADDGASALNAFHLTRVAQQRTGRVLTDGLASGAPPREIIAEMRDVLGEDRMYEAYARTAVQAVNNRALDTLYKDNQELLNGVQYMASLDDRTCLICAGYDGRIYWYDPQPGQEDAADRPQVPVHVRCRCIYTPVVKSFKQLGISSKDVPARVAKALTGDVGRALGYAAWLAGRSESLQRAILGPSRHELYKAGLPVQRFAVGNNITTLDDLATVQTGEIRARQVNIPRVSGSGSHLAQQGLRPGGVADVAQRANALANEPGLELVVRKGARSTMADALRQLPASARKRVHVLYLQKQRFTSLGADDVAQQSYQAVQVTGLNAEELRVLARHLADNVASPFPDIRIRGADVGWTRRWLSLGRSRSGYVERVMPRRLPGSIAIEVPPGTAGSYGGGRNLVLTAEEQASMLRTMPDVPGRTLARRRGRTLGYRLESGENVKWMSMP